MQVRYASAAPVALLALVVPPVSGWRLPGVIGALVLLVLAGLIIHSGWLRSDPEQSTIVNPFTEIQPSPLLIKETAVSLWDGVTIGFLKSGHPLLFRGQDTSLLVAGEPRAGKTVLLNNIIAAAALDPRTRVALFDGKGANTFRHWQGIADRVDRSGSAGALLTYLTTVLQEIERRYDALADLDEEKLTKQIYQTSMPLFLVVIDELANFTMPYPNKKLGQGVVSALAQIAAKGPAAGVVLVMATQHPSVDVVPSIIRNNVSMRIAFRVASPQASNIVLGQGMAKQGFDASSIMRMTERGIGFADIDGHWPKKFRSCLIEYQDTKVIAQRARAVRSGIPLQELPEAPALDRETVPSRSLVHDIRHIWHGAERLHNSVILERLRTLDPAYYGEWSAQLFGRRIRDVGLARFKKQWTEGDRVNHWGLPAHALEAELPPDDGTTPSERRREREALAMESLDEVGLLAYQARVAEIEAAKQCEYCEDSLSPENPPTVDHWWPLAKGGTNQPDNLRAACGSCNSSKRDRDPVAWLKERLRKAA